MCEIVGKAHEHGLSRRGFLGRAGVVAGAVAGGALLNGAPAGAESNGRVLR